MFRHHWSTKLASSCQLTLSRCWSSFYTSKKRSTLQRWTEISYRYDYIYICIFISQLGIYILLVVHIGTIHMIKWSTGGAALPAAAQEALPPGSWRTVHYGKSGQSLSNIHIYHIYPYIYPYPNIYQYLSTYTYTHPTYYVIYTHLFSFWNPPIPSFWNPRRQVGCLLLHFGHHLFRHLLSRDTDLFIDGFLGRTHPWNSHKTIIPLVFSMNMLFFFSTGICQWMFELWFFEAWSFSFSRVVSIVCWPNGCGMQPDFE